MIEIFNESFTQKRKFLIYSSSRPLPMIEDCHIVPCSVQTTCTGRCCRWRSSTPTWELHPGAWSPYGAGPVCWRPTCAACMTCCPCWTGNGISSSTSVPPTSPPGQHHLRQGSERTTVLLQFFEVISWLVLRFTNFCQLNLLDTKHLL